MLSEKPRKSSQGLISLMAASRPNANCGGSDTDGLLLTPCKSWTNSSKQQPYYICTHLDTEKEIYSKQTNFAIHDCILIWEWNTFLLL